MALSPTLISLLLLCFFIQSCYARVFTFEMHHRYSHPSHSHTKRRFNPKSIYNHNFHRDFPKEGSFDYYAALAARDRYFRRHGRRKLFEEVEDEPLTFSDGNSTFRISSLGFLHYTTVTLGTPGMKFLVALDTGSDLFWVPCDCSRCAPIDGTTYASEYKLSIYNPKASSTSKRVSCSNRLCLHHSKCSGSFNQCPYVISYVSAETSTSGILVEDVLHLITEDRHHELVQAYITFGCGRVQTGSFLDVAAPNGLFGLGMENISVPSILSREGFTADSFSMCFGHDGVGRISFGDKGSPDQLETPFNVNPSHPSYNISVNQIWVGTAFSNVDFTALFDSGTSFTYLVEPAYSKLSESFDSQVKDERLPADSRIPFEFCYGMRSGKSNANARLIPSLTLVMEGGSHFTVYDPKIVISTQNELLYCLAVVRSTELNIIGQNFMTGYHIVFDREKLVLGWENSDCYDIHVNDSVGGDAIVVPAAVAAQPDNRTADVARSTAHHLAASPLIPCHFCRILACFIAFLFVISR